MSHTRASWWGNFLIPDDTLPSLYTNSCLRGFLPQENVMPFKRKMPVCIWVMSFLTVHKCKHETPFLKFIFLSLSFANINFLCVWAPSLHVCLHPLIAYWLWRPEEGSDPLDLELQMVVSCHVGAGNWTHVFWKSSSCCALNCWVDPLDPSFLLRYWCQWCGNPQCILIFSLLD